MDYGLGVEKDLLEYSDAPGTKRWVASNLADGRLTGDQSQLCHDLSRAHLGAFLAGTFSILRRALRDNLHRRGSEKYEENRGLLAQC